MAKLRENGFALTLVVGLALALAVGIAYSLTTENRRLALEAESLHAAHETVQAVTVVRSQLELGAYQASLLETGVGVDPDAIVAAAARADDALSDAAAAMSVLQSMGVTDRPLAAAYERFEMAATALSAALTGPATADLDGLESSYGALLVELNPLRDRLVSAVASAERSNAWEGAIAGFLAVFAIPAAVISTYFVMDRRRRRAHDLEMALEAERAALQSRETFLNTVFHQLRKPLTGVRGIAQMLAGDRGLMSQPRMPDLHALLVGELDDMTSLVDDLLTASRLEAGALEYVIEPVDVKDEARWLFDNLNPRGASIYFAMDDGVVNADRRRLRQIIRNLLSNALKYGGPNIEVKGHADEDSYTVVIVDDGQGVPRSVEEHLFTRFVHGDDNQNVGLGLSIVMALAVGMGGTAFHRREDGLTRFGVRLPAATTSARRVPQYEPPTMTAATQAGS